MQRLEVDARIVKAMNDASKYNVLGCRHGNYNGYVPTSFMARGASRTKTRWPIAIRRLDGAHFSRPASPPSASRAPNRRAGGEQTAAFAKPS